MESDGRIDGNSRHSRPVTVISLTNLQITRAKPKPKQYKLADERGMYLLVVPKGAEKQFSYSGRSAIKWK